MTWSATCHLDEFGNGITFIKEAFNGILPHPLCDNTSKFELFAGESPTIAPGDTGGVDTYFGISLSECFYAKISDLAGSGMSPTATVSKDLLHVGYTKNIRVALYNHSFRNRRILVGDAIAVIIIDDYFATSGRVYRRLNFGGRGAAPYRRPCRRLGVLGRSIAPSRRVCRRLGFGDSGN